MIPDNRPVRGSLASITPLEFIQVQRTPEEALFNSLMEQYHYLGYEQPIGEKPEVSGESQRSGDRMRGLVKRATPPKGARPIPRME